MTLTRDKSLRSCLLCFGSVSAPNQGGYHYLTRTFVLVRAIVSGLLSGIDGGRNSLSM